MSKRSRKMELAQEKKGGWPANVDSRVVMANLATEQVTELRKLGATLKSVELYFKIIGGVLALQLVVGIVLAIKG